MTFQSPQNAFNTVIAGNGVIYVSLKKSMTIDLLLAEQIVTSCLENTTDIDESIGLVINMSKVAFVTENARNFLVDKKHSIKGITHLALVSDNHFSNVISTLMIENCDADEVLPMKLLKTTESAIDWIQLELKLSERLEQAV